MLNTCVSGVGENEDDVSYTIDVDDTNNMGLLSGNSSGNHTSGQHNSTISLAFQRWYSMFVKRLLHSRRHKLSIVSQLVLPLTFTLIALISAKTFPQPGDSPALSLNTSSFGQNNVPFTASNRFVVISVPRGGSTTIVFKRGVGGELHL